MRNVRLIVLAVALAALCLTAAAPAGAEDICEAIALRDVPDIDNPANVLKRGERDTAITQYRVNKHSGLTSFCSHGGGCYPTHVVVDGQKIEALRLTNCKIGKQDEWDDPDEVLYHVDVDRSKVSPALLKYEDVDNKLLEMGLCNACASNAASLTLDKPGSRCARLTRRALAGEPAAKAKLVEFPDYCNEAAR
jgi:hypothetical protein